MKRPLDFIFPRFLQSCLEGLDDQNRKRYLHSTQKPGTIQLSKQLHYKETKALRLTYISWIIYHPFVLFTVIDHY